MLRPSSASPFHRGQCPITRQPRPAKTPSARHDWRAALIEGSSHVRVFVSGGILTDNVGHCFSAPRHVSWLPSTGWISRPIHQPGRSVADGPAPPQPTHFDGTHTMASHTGASVLKESLFSLPPPPGGTGTGSTATHQPWYGRPACHNHPPLFRSILLPTPTTRWKWSRARLFLRLPALPGCVSAKAIAGEDTVG